MRIPKTATRQVPLLLLVTISQQLFHNTVRAFPVDLTSLGQVLQSADEVVFAAFNWLEASSPQTASSRIADALPIAPSTRQGNKLSPFVMHLQGPTTLFYQDEDDNQTDTGKTKTSSKRFAIDMSMFFPNNGQLQQEQTLSQSISLTKEESDLFHLVRKVRDARCPGTTLRVAGGWVRDKLLGVDTASCTSDSSTATSSADIDFVLNDISGSEFARMVRDYLVEEQQRLQQQQTDNSDGGSKNNHGDTKIDNLPPALKDFGNVEGLSSQHLQTATLQIGPLDVDFCQLRFEKYKTDSRVPSETGIATVVEDAFRRDLTINALYYNLNTNEVEDWTEQGFRDLQVRTIATPRAALPTLLEDPLRILRAIRFAAQLSFQMDPSLKKGALDRRVRQALRTKVSKDRIGKEIDTIFQTTNPTLGLELLIETRLADVVFPLNDNADEQQQRALSRIPPFFIYSAGFQSLFRTQTLLNRIVFAAQSKPTKQNWDATKRRYLWYAGFFKPFYDMLSSSTETKRANSDRQHRRRDKSIVHKLLSKSLKRPTAEIESVEAIVRGARILKPFLGKYDASTHRIQQSLLSKLEDPMLNERLDEQDPRWKSVADLRWMCYKLLKRIGPLWKESLVLALAHTTEYKLADAVQRFEGWVTTIEDELGLTAAILEPSALKPLLNGNQVQTRALRGALGATFKQVMTAQEEWQVRHCVGGASADSNPENQEDALIEHLVGTFPQFRYLRETLTYR